MADRPPRDPADDVPGDDPSEPGGDGSGDHGSGEHDSGGDEFGDDEFGDDEFGDDEFGDDEFGDGSGDRFDDAAGAGPDDGVSPFDFDLHGEDLHGEPLPLDPHESALVEQDLVDLDQFEATFRADGYRGVSVFCRDCEVEHYYPWDLLRENLKLLLETGETPVHEPAFDPNPSDYVPWDYARGYADALTDAGVDERREVDGCPSCGLELPGGWKQANFCPRCATPLLAPRLIDSLTRRGLGTDDIRAVLHEMGLPG